MSRPSVVRAAIDRWPEDAPARAAAEELRRQQAERVRQEAERERLRAEAEALAARRRQQQRAEEDALIAAAEELVAERRRQERLAWAQAVISGDVPGRMGRSPIPREIRRAGVRARRQGLRRVRAAFDIQYDHIIPSRWAALPRSRTFNCSAARVTGARAHHSVKVIALIPAA
jgi:hypothetical protein